MSAGRTFDFSEGPEMSCRVRYAPSPFDLGEEEGKYYPWPRLLSVKAKIESGRLVASRYDNHVLALVDEVAAPLAEIEKGRSQAGVAHSSSRRSYFHGSGFRAVSGAKVCGALGALPPLPTLADPCRVWNLPPYRSRMDLFVQNPRMGMGESVAVLEPGDVDGVCRPHPGRRVFALRRTSPRERNGRLSERSWFASRGILRRQ